MNRFLLSCLLFCCVVFTHAQQPKDSLLRKKESTNPTPAGPKPVSLQELGGSSRVYQTPPPPPGINYEDQYMGREKEFLNILTLDKLPADFPKNKKGMTIKEYNDILEMYYRAHPELLKKMYRDKLKQ